jgi:hypothetical protein
MIHGLGEAHLNRLAPRATTDNYVVVTPQIACYDLAELWRLESASPRPSLGAIMADQRKNALDFVRLPVRNWSILNMREAV